MTLKELDLKTGDLVVVGSRWNERAGDSTPLIFIRYITEFVGSSMLLGSIMMDPCGKLQCHDGWEPAKIISRVEEAHG